MKMSNVNFNFLGKIVVVFGGSRGIGNEICRQFVLSGAQVYNASRTSSGLKNVKNIKCDVSREEEILATFSNFEKIDLGFYPEVINLAKYNILVNCICPSQTMTEMLSESMTKESLDDLESRIPVRRVSSTIEQALPVLFLCSDAASYIAGAAIDINGGQL